MAYSIDKGTIYIELTDFWHWLGDQYENHFDRSCDDVIFDESTFDVKNEELYIEFNKDGKHGILFVDAVDLWEFIHEYVPCTGAEVLFGKPKLTETLEVNFAAGSDTDPASRADRPECLKEWSE